MDERTDGTTDGATDGTADGTADGAADGAAAGPAGATGPTGAVGATDAREAAAPSPGHLALRPLADEDLDALFHWMRHPEAVAQAAFTRPDPDDRAAFDAWVVRVRGTPDAVMRAVEVDGVFAATVGSYDSDVGREVACWVDPGRWGTGVATTALRVFLETEEHRRPLVARVAEHNAGSLKVLVRNGFRVVGSEPAFADGIGRDVVEQVLRLDA